MAEDEKDERRAERASDRVSFEEALGKWELALADDFEADSSAEQLGADDFAIRINAKA